VGVVSLSVERAIKTHAIYSCNISIHISDICMIRPSIKATYADGRIRSVKAVHSALGLGLCYQSLIWS
jgi:hypothetical protein